MSVYLFMKWEDDGHSGKFGRVLHVLASSVAQILDRSIQGNQVGNVCVVSVCFVQSQLNRGANS